MPRWTQFEKITAAFAGRGLHRVPHRSWRDLADALRRREAQPGAVPLPRAERMDGAPRARLDAAARSDAAAPRARPDAAARGAAEPPPPGLVQSGRGRTIAAPVLTGLAAVLSPAARRCEAPPHRGEWPAAPGRSPRAGLLPPVGSAQRVARRGAAHSAAGCRATQRPGGFRSAAAVGLLGRLHGRLRRCAPLGRRRTRPACCTRRRIAETPGFAAGQRSRRRQRSARNRTDERPGRLEDCLLRTDARTGSSGLVAQVTLAP